MDVADEYLVPTDLEGATLAHDCVLVVEAALAAEVEAFSHGAAG